MSFLIIATGVLFSLFSTLVLSYVSMATMVGPWIAPTLVLLGHILFSLGRNKYSEQESQASIAWMQAIGSGGGIVATGVGFALPMLFFLDPIAFSQLLASPWYFCTLISLLCLIAGGLGLWLGRFWAETFLEEQKLPFPVSNLTYQVITSQAHPKQARQLMQSISATLVVCALRDGIGKIGGLIAKTYYPLSSLFGRELAISIWPSLWSIGFTVGLPITIPLCIGLISKYLVLYPLANHANYLPFGLFQPLATETFAIAFCSGLVLIELILGLPKYIRIACVWLKQTYYGTKPQTQQWTDQVTNFMGKIQSSNLSRAAFIELGVISLGVIALLTYFEFTVLSQALLICFVIIATYSICQIGGKIGMIPFGRYSTFIVVPLLLLFNLTAIQATITCVFFNICAAATSDLLFDYKTALLGNLDRKRMYRYQWIGLIATALCLGIFLWLLFTHLQLGTEALFAQRGKAKALLLQSLHFDKYIVGLGLIFGWMLKKLKINPTMVFGGLIMPNSVSIGLTIGSLGTLLTKNPECFQPLCAGALAAESLWILVSILAGMV